MADWYDILGVSPTADAAAIKKSYRRLAAKAHPDTGGSAALFRLVQEANEVLSDPTRRAEYDRARSVLTGDRSATKSPAERRMEELLRAQSAYTYFSNAYNLAGERAWASLPSDEPSWNDYPSMYALRAEADRQFVREISGFEWPESVVPFARDLVAAQAEEAGLNYRLSMLEGDESTLTPVILLAEHAAEAAVVAAHAMRGALGLAQA